MRKIICLSIVILFVIGLTGCGKNPVFTHLASGGGGSTTQGAAMSAAAAKMAVQMVSTSSGGGSAPSYQGAPSYKAAGMTFSDGILTITDESGGYMKFFYLNAGGSTINAADLSSWMTAAMNPVTGAKRGRFQASMADGGVSIVADITITYVNVGDIYCVSGNGALTGTETVTSGSDSFDVTFSNIEISNKKPVSGSISLSLTSDVYGNWTVVLTFNADGSADGTITGPGYSATVHINADGAGTYTDSSGTHTIS